MKSVVDDKPGLRRRRAWKWRRRTRASSARRQARSRESTCLPAGSVPSAATVGTFQPLAGATITTTPAMQMAAPSRSQRSGLNPSTSTPHKSASATNTPP